MSAPLPLPTHRDHRWWVLAVMLTAEIMDLLDSTVVNVAGPSLKADLGASPTTLQWVIGGYPLALGAGLILGGRLGDRFGRRTVFLLGLIGFTVFSLACALAPSSALLIAFRLIQGGFGAVLLPQGIGLLRAAFPPQDLGKAFSVFGPVFGLAGIFGPLIGGGIVQADVLGTGWRGVFLVNVPFGIAATIIAWRVLPRDDADRTLGVDLVGAAIVVAASTLVVLPLIQGQELGWPVWTVLSLVVGVVGYLGFALQQRRRLAHGRSPLVTPSIFGRSHYLMGLVGLTLFFCGMVGVQLVFTLFLQIGQGYSAGAAGLATLPIAIGSGLGGGISGALLADRLGRAVLQVGAVVELLGVVLLRVLLDPGNVHIGQLIPGLVLVGLGSGVVIAALFNILLAGVEDHESGSASGVMTAVQSIASSVGVAVFGAVFFHRVQLGQTTAGFQTALLVQAGLLLAFLAVSPLFPRRARDGEGWSVDDADQPAVEQA